ncbi:hypothetical protein M422DRAFT_164665 [Sphaerobolus stellatus SS14]|uniref:Cytochrome P450 n=1 Tax=Sphaerobolus stellatus (strain SS14) TaxID=990650 RepID=A0A0C9W550_SPHS4|nr:hypothetical protein M422DRAFT_164665 [Sphaerobolus stellatus SS14]
MLITIAYFIFKRKNQKLSFPPGPMPLPLVGNLFDMPQAREWEAYTKWGAKYGDVVHVSAFGHHIIVLNSFKAARDLLDLRSTKYSSRPYVPMLHDPELMDAGWSFTFMTYEDPRWKRHRRLFVEHFNASAVRSFEAQQLKGSHALLRSLLAHNEIGDLEEALRNTAAGIMMDITYGYDIKLKDDPFVEIATRAANEITQGISPSGFFVNLFPWMKYIPAWFPGGGYKHFAAQARKSGQELVDVPFAFLKQSIATGTARPSFASDALTDSADPVYVRDIKEISAAIYGGGADTTVGLIHACVLALILNPHAQQRAQEELDTVIGSPDSNLFRLPIHEDRDRLPYIDAILKEAIRWWQPVPTALPHATTEEDEYRGWHIPKGTIVMINAWGILHDEIAYPQPYQFRPERFLNGDGKVIDDPAVGLSFGSGRRICPGRPFAETALWIQIASLLAAFHLESPKDEDGNSVDITYAKNPKSGYLL